MIPPSRKLWLSAPHMPFLSSSSTQALGSIFHHGGGAENENLQESRLGNRKEGQRNTSVGVWHKAQKAGWGPEEGDPLRSVVPRVSPWRTSLDWITELGHGCLGCLWHQGPLLPCLFFVGGTYFAVKMCSSASTRTTHEDLVQRN